MKKYDKYKKSGVEWLGEIPEHWEIRKIKYLFYIGRGRVISQQELDKKGQFPVYSSQTKNDGILGFIKTYDYNYPQITWTTDGANAGTVFLRKGKYNCTNVCGTLKQKNVNEIIEFITYSLQLSTKFYKRPDTNGAKIMNNEMAEIFITYPPLAEQTAIANFLDEKTAKIDKAIANKQKLIDLLKERKQIIIQNAVTKGLNPNAKMKFSGVEWIGDIPEHWEVKKLKYLFKLGKGLTITKENLKDTGIFCINYGEIHSKYGFEVNPQIHKLKCVDKEYLINSKKSLIENGDFVFADTSEDIEGCGNFTYLNYKEKIFAGYHTITLKPIDNIKSKFFAYIFHSLSFRNQIRTNVKGVKVFSITQSILKEPIVWFPHKKEQIEIMNYLESETAKIDRAINLQEKQIEKLKEYKTVLIDSAVTGKIKVS